jgi:3-oxoacyl-[acyl-carrier protein] reductase
MNLNNAVILITGASKGIGLAIAELCLQQNAYVCMFSRSGAPIELMEQYKDKIVDIHGSIQHEDDIMRCINIIKERFGRIDILINNAGIASFASLWDITSEDANSMIQTNLLGLFYSVKHAFPLMKQENKPTFVVTIHSIAATTIFSQSSVYAATKSGALAMMKSFRVEARPFGISVIDVLPGATATEIWDKEFLQQNKHRMMKPEEIAQSVVSALQLSRNESKTLCVEELVLRPWTGDL